MRKPLVLAAVLVAGLLAWASPCAADTVVLFTDGRYLRVQSHEIEGAWLRLDVGPRSWCEIPLRRVESIERNGQPVWRRPAEIETTQAGTSGTPEIRSAPSVWLARGAPARRPVSGRP